MFENIQDFNNTLFENIIRNLTYVEEKSIKQDEIILLDKNIYDKCHLSDIKIKFNK